VKAARYPGFTDIDSDKEIKGRTRLKTQVCTVGHKSHDPSFHKKYMESGVMTFVAHCTVEPGWNIRSRRCNVLKLSVVE